MMIIARVLLLPDRSRCASTDSTGVTFNMILDENLNNYIEMYDILKETVQTADLYRHNRQVTERPLDMDIRLITLSSKNNANREIIYYDTRLTSIGDIEFEATRADVQYITVPLSFEFNYFEIK